jgi:hypothetical protein
VLLRWADALMQLDLALCFHLDTRAEPGIPDHRLPERERDIFILLLEFLHGNALAVSAFLGQFQPCLTHIA